MDHNMIMRPMRREELDTLVEWAAAEGWNPGLNDAEVFWLTDPEGFIAAEIDGQLIGGGSIVSYAGQYGFMGFFIIHPDWRGQGLGNQLWHERKRLLRKRLEPSAPIGMDGVFDMQHYYAKGGFEFVCRDIRYAGVGARLGASDDSVVNLEQVPFEWVDQYDQRHFPAPRPVFLKHWIKPPMGYSIGVVKDDGLAGYAVLRPCREGHKIGPLFADSVDVAERLYLAVANHVPDQAIFLDVPENNPDAVALAERHAMKPVFGCAKMILGNVPELPDREIFGVTTFELG